MDLSEHNISPYIIAGGHSLRMGQDKRLLSYQGMTLIERVYLLAEFVTGIKPVLVGDNLDASFFSSFERINDAAQGKGPLAGIVAALEHSMATWTLLLPVDMPRLNHDMIISLIKNIDEYSDSVTFSVDGFIECFPVIFKTSTLYFWRERLEGNQLSLIEGIKLLQNKTIDFSSDKQSFFNLNTPQDVHKCKKSI